MSHRGFTAIEMLTVLSVMGVLAAIAAPAMVPSLRRGLGNQGANAVLSVAAHARTQSLSHDRPAAGSADAGKHYGVVLYRDGSSWVAALTYGATADPSTILRRNPSDSSSDPVVQSRLGPNAQIVTDSGANQLAWLYQYRSGAVIEAPGSNAAHVDVGLPGSPITELFQVMSPDGNHAVDLAVYRIGMAGSNEVN
ncbi:MAG: type II secretion system protein [Planctomycetota bacterium]|jgi:prepilin-type N-terminal cleavage/methylation domain-containing protein|nr:type II secretion system protein [Planctomycetota bacterium]